MFLILPWWALAKTQAWPNDGHRALLNNNFLVYELWILFCTNWWWGFSGERQQSLHLCVCEMKNLLRSTTTAAAPVGIRCHGSCPDFNENCSQIINLYVTSLWLLHQTFVVSSSSEAVSMKIFEVVLFLPHFISSFHHLCFDVATSKYNLGFTDYKREAELKWFIVRVTEVRSRPTAHEKLLILLFCPKHWARPLLALVVPLQDCFWNALIFEMQIPWHFRWNLIEQVYFSEEILRNLTT